MLVLLVLLVLVPAPVPVDVPVETDEDLLSSMVLLLLVLVPLLEASMYPSPSLTTGRGGTTTHMDCMVCKRRHGGASHFLGS